MSWLSRIFRRGSDDDTPLASPVDLPVRQEQLAALESALDALTSGMRDNERLMDNPGWRGRVAEYDRAATTAGQLRRGQPTREQLVDLAFEIRPLFTGAAPQGQEHLVPLQEAVVAAAQPLGEALPSERT